MNSGVVVTCDLHSSISTGTAGLDTRYRRGSMNYGDSGSVVVGGGGGTRGVWVGAGVAKRRGSQHTEGLQRVPTAPCMERNECYCQ